MINWILIFLAIYLALGTSLAQFYMRAARRNGVKMRLWALIWVFGWPYYGAISAFHFWCLVSIEAEKIREAKKQQKQG